MLKFSEVNLNQAELILNWRTSERVKKFMTTDIVFDLEMQKRWLLSCYENPNYYHWIIEIEDNPIGLINISGLDICNKTTSWGFYIGDRESMGYGAFVPPFLYNFLFRKLKIKTINVEVFEANIGVLGLHRLHGYTQLPERNRVVKKDGDDIPMVGLQLSAESWMGNKRFENQIADFPVSLWKAKPHSLF